jgi:hypothetical protein
MRLFQRLDSGLRRNDGFVWTDGGVWGYVHNLAVWQ